MPEGGGGLGTAMEAPEATGLPREPPPPVALGVRAEAHVEVPSASEINKMKVSELRAVLSSLGQPSDGLKAVLVSRLLDAAAAVPLASGATATRLPRCSSPGCWTSRGARL